MCITVYPHIILYVCIYIYTYCIYIYIHTIIHIMCIYVYHCVSTYNRVYIYICLQVCTKHPWCRSKASCSRWGHPLLLWCRVFGRTCSGLVVRSTARLLAGVPCWLLSFLGWSLVLDFCAWLLYRFDLVPVVASAHLRSIPITFCASLFLFPCRESSICFVGVSAWEPATTAKLIRLLWICLACGLLWLVFLPGWLTSFSTCLDFLLNVPGHLLRPVVPSRSCLLLVRGFQVLCLFLEGYRFLGQQHINLPALSQWSWSKDLSPSGVGFYEAARLTLTCHSSSIHSQACPRQGKCWSRCRGRKKGYPFFSYWGRSQQTQKSWLSG